MFIDRLNEALHKKNISGNTLCKMIGIPNANYTNWKKQTPKGETLKLIANALEVSVDWLLEREGAAEPEQVKLVKDYLDSDERGKENIIRIADFEAKRSRKNSQEETAEELKPFA